ncbi:MAG: CinA family nicotinamide mononucleotide deamidase-related protein [Chloroflexi bacterium]|nr:CinA family nicotinamide mononucleotide deamidase-related protein [Chloroflexota bacterium]
MNAEIIAIGHELLMGETVDTNTSFLAQELSRAGIPVRWAGIVGDDISDLNYAISQAGDRADVIVTTGGLGPTSDDLTREAVAGVLLEEMKVDSGLLEWLEGVFVSRGMPMPRTNIKQAMLIPSAETVPNPQGTAPGWWVRKNDTHIILLPGPPRELKRMWTETVGPELALMSGVGSVVTRTLKTVGISEGGIDEMLHGLFGLQNPYLGIYAHQDGIHLRMIARAPEEDEAQVLIQPMESEIRSIIGEAIWGVDDETPGNRARELLSASGATLGVIEGISGGVLASQLTQPNAHSNSFKGSLIASANGIVEVPGGGTFDANDMTGGPAALEMANRARTLFNSDYGLCVSARDESGYYIAIASSEVQHVSQIQATYARAVTMQRSATTALVQLVSILKR